MTAEKRRVLRMICKALLLITLPLTGFVWALPENSSMLMVAGGLTLLSLIVGFGAELFASATENDLKVMSAKVMADNQRRVEELQARDEQLRQFDRIVGLLTEQNQSLRGQLLGVQMELQRRRDMLSAQEDVLGLEDIAQPQQSAFAGRAH